MFCVFQSLLETNVCSPQLPLPCISSAATRVYFGHQRRQAEGEVFIFFLFFLFFYFLQTFIKKKYCLRVKCLFFFFFF